MNTDQCSVTEWRIKRNQKQRIESLQTNVPTNPLSVRTLKIEACGDFWKGLIKPKIRLIGRWLERAGFRAGERVSVRCVALGVIELRTSDADAGEIKPTPGREVTPELGPCGYGMLNDRSLRDPNAP